MGVLLAFVIGAAALGVAVFFHMRRQGRRADLVSAPLRAVGLTEELGSEDDIYHHVVYEVLEGPHAGQQLVSELGHGREPKLPQGVQTELIHIPTSSVYTRGALRVEAVLIFVFGAAGLTAIAAAFYMAAL